MNTQPFSFTASGRAHPGAGPSQPAGRALAPGQALHLGRRGGELSILSGSVWLTRRSDGGDHRLHAGQRMHLLPNDQAVIESWDSAATAQVSWSPRYRSFPAALLAEPLRVVAFLAGRLATGCATLSQRAAASARRADAAGDTRGNPSPAPSCRT